MQQRAKQRIKHNFWLRGGVLDGSRRENLTWVSPESITQSPRHLRRAVLLLLASCGPDPRPSELFLSSPCSFFAFKNGSKIIARLLESQKLPPLSLPFSCRATSHNLPADKILELEQHCLDCAGSDGCSWQASCCL